MERRFLPAFYSDQDGNFTAQPSLLAMEGTRATNPLAEIAARSGSHTSDPSSYPFKRTITLHVATRERSASQSAAF